MPPSGSAQEDADPLSARFLEALVGDSVLMGSTIGARTAASSRAGIFMLAPPIPHAPTRLLEAHRECDDPHPA